MKKFTFTLLAALLCAMLTAFSSAEETIDQQKTLNELHALENQASKQTQQQVQQPTQSQGQQQTQQQAQQQVQRPTQNQSQQQTQRPTQSQGQQQQQIQRPTQSQTQQQGQRPTQSQRQRQGQQQSQQQQIQSPTQGQGQQQQSQTQQQSQQQAQQPTYVKVGPHWKIGTTWSVETVNLQKQGTVQKQQKPLPVVWVFTVIGETKIGNRDCFEVAIRCKDDADRQPHVSIWVDKASGMLMRVTTQTLVKGQWHMFTETYAVPEGKSVAVLGTIPSLPLDMPLFTQEARSKDLDGMTYEVVTGAKGAKDLGEAGFTYKIDQAIRPISEEKSKELAKAKSLDAPLNLKEAVEVELQGGPANRVKQVWVPGNPWPTYSTNGTSESRLIDVTVPQEN